MDIKIKRRSNKTQIIGSHLELYSHDLQMYKIPPTENISLQEFENLALERLKLLRSLAKASTLHGHRLHSSDWIDSVLKDLRSENLKYYEKLFKTSGCGSNQDDVEARRKDHIAHFILRLAYCRTEELRRWFIARELELFQMRFIGMSDEVAVDRFFKLNDLHYTDITSEEKNDIINCLRESTPHKNIESSKIYKVKFYEVLNLVRSRKVYIKSGYAYIPHNNLISVLLAQYRKHLKQSLAIACHHLREIEQDSRLVSFLTGLPLSYIGNDYINTKALVPIESLDSLSIKSFPLCMRQLHEQLRSAHHLKHGGRLQYGLFLKGIGVTLEDSLKFWRDEFTKIMDLDKFEKHYSYNVRYNYGKEGSKKNYSPFSCMKIINESVGPGDCHGCPYKHSDVSNLKNKLLGYGFDSQAIHGIVDMAKKGHFQIACSKYFDAVHSVDLNLGINHPNQFFEESQKLINGDIKIEATKEGKNSTVKKEVINDNDIEDMDFEEII